MLVVIVDVWVKPDGIAAFTRATKDNAVASLLEPGVLRFDVLADHADPAHFQLIEVYRTDAAPGAHKQTAHYATWRDLVEPLMARPRSSQKFHNVFPADDAY